MSLRLYSTPLIRRGRDYLRALAKYYQRREPEKRPSLLIPSPPLSLCLIKLEVSWDFF